MVQVPDTGAVSVDELARDAQAGSKASFAQLIERYRGPLFRFLALRADSAADAEELCQETFLRAWEKLDRFSPRWRFSTWLFAIGRHLAASRRRASPPPSAGGEALEGLQGPGDPAEALSEREERDGIWSVADRVLSTEQRSALWLRYGEGLAPAEIARILGKRSVAVRVLLFRARETLARHLEPPAGAARLESAPVSLREAGGSA